jgi:hypothetical protein
MHFTNVLKDFAEQWESLKEKKEEDAPTVPTITRALPIVNVDPSDLRIHSTEPVTSSLTPGTDCLTVTQRHQTPTANRCQSDNIM